MPIAAVAQTVSVGVANVDGENETPVVEWTGYSPVLSSVFGYGTASATRINVGDGYLGTGLRRQIPVGTDWISPYVELLLGTIFTEDGNSGLMASPGAGVDVAFTDQHGVRASVHGGLGRHGRVTTLSAFYRF